MYPAMAGGYIAIKAHLGQPAKVYLPYCIVPWHFKIIKVLTRGIEPKAIMKQDYIIPDNKEQ